MQVYVTTSQKSGLLFSLKNLKFPKGIVWPKKLAETATVSDVQIFA